MNVHRARIRMCLYTNNMFYTLQGQAQRELLLCQNLHKNSNIISVSSIVGLHKDISILNLHDRNRKLTYISKVKLRKTGLFSCILCLNVIIVYLLGWPFANWGEK